MIAAGAATWPAAGGGVAAPAFQHVAPAAAASPFIPPAVAVDPAQRRIELLRELLMLEGVTDMDAVSASPPLPPSITPDGPSGSSSLTHDMRKLIELVGTGGRDENVTLPLEGRHFRVGVVVDPPFVIDGPLPGSAVQGVARNASQLNNLRYSGILMDVLWLHSSILGFTYEILEPPDRVSGVKQPNGSYNGLMGMFQRREVDLVYSGLAITTDRAQFVSFTQPFLQSGLKLYVPRPRPDLASDWFILAPFKTELWLTLFGTVLGMSMVFYTIDRLSPYGKRQEGNPNWLYHALGGVLLSVDEFLTINHHGVASSILTLAWTFAVLAIVTLYTANMMSFLTVQKLTTPITSLSDIALKSAKTGMVKGTFGLQWIKMNVPQISSLIHEYATAPDAIEAMRRGDVQACILKSPVADYFAGRPPCDGIAVGQVFATNFIGVGVQKGQDYASLLNSLVIEQVAGGEMEKVVHHWVVNQCTSVNDSDNASGASSLGVKDIRGVFYIIGVGIAVALMCLCYQVLIYRLVLQRTGILMNDKALTAEGMLRCITNFGQSSGRDSLPTVPVRHCKMHLRKLGLLGGDIRVIMAAVDHNGDGFLDLYDLERLQKLLHMAKEAATEHLSPYSLNQADWRMPRLESMRWDAHGAFTRSMSSLSLRSVSRDLGNEDDEDEEAKVVTRSSGGRYSAGPKEEIEKSSRSSTET